MQKSYILIWLVYFFYVNSSNEILTGCESCTLLWKYDSNILGFMRW